MAAGYILAHITIRAPVGANNAMIEDDYEAFFCYVRGSLRKINRATQRNYFHMSKHTYRHCNSNRNIQTRFHSMHIVFCIFMGSPGSPEKEANVKADMWLNVIIILILL